MSGRIQRFLVYLRPVAVACPFFAVALARNRSSSAQLDQCNKSELDKKLISGSIISGMGNHLKREEPSQSSLGSEPRTIVTSLISGSSMKNVCIKDSTVAGQLFNIYSSNSSPVKKSNVWFKMREPIASYTGREDKLEEVHNIFLPTNNEIKPDHLVAVIGLGGIGKSEFARKFAHIYYTAESDRNVVWINAETERLTDSFKGLATLIFEIEFAELSEQDKILQMVDQVYEYFGTRNSLFIFDNVEDWVDAVKDYLPTRMAPDVKPFVLLTSRNRPSGIKVIELPVLEVAEAVELIKTRLEVKESDGQCFHLLSELANLLGCLPLALQQASSYIKQEMESDISGKQQNEKLASCIEIYITKFKVETENLLNYKPSPREFDVDFKELQTTLLTWRITLEKIQGLNPSAIKLLKMMSYISPDDIHLKMFESQFTFDDLKTAVNTLVRFSMITKDSESSIVSVHRLVQTVVRLGDGEKHERTQQREKATKRKDEENKPLESVLNLININLGGLRDEITPYSTSCVNHAQVAWEHAVGYPKLLKQFEDYPKKLYKIAELHGMHTTNLSLLQRTLSKYKQHSIYGESDEQYIRLQHLISIVLLDLHKYEDAKSLCNLIHKTATDNLEESHPLILAILNNLTLAESGLGNYSEQIDILDKIIAANTLNTRPYLSSLHNKAACLSDMGKYNEALEIFKSTLELNKAHYPEDRKSINETRYMIAITTQRKGNFSAALQMFTELHAERVTSLGESHTDTLQCALKIGECLMALGEYVEAVQILKCNMELAEGNPDARLQCVNIKCLIGVVLLGIRRYDEAISQFRIVLREQLSVFRETHPEVLETRVWLARALQNTGRTGDTEEALGHYEFVYENRVKALGADHPNTIKVNDYKEAILNNQSQI